MSIHLMNQAWRTTLATGAKFVLVAVCDTANDEGVCWPSVETIRRKCSMGERTVQRHLDDLEQAGIISRSFRKGRSTTYQVHESKFPIETAPAKLTPPQERHPRQIGTPPNWHLPRQNDGAPPPNSTETPAKLAPRTTNNLKENPQGTGRTPESTPVDNSGPKASAQGARLPDDWVLTKKLALWALQEQPTWTEEHVRKVAAAFRDHWIAQPGAKGRRTDWEATWRNWVRREPALKGGAGTPQSGGDVRWFETPQGVEAQAKLHNMRDRKPDEDWRSYRVLVVRAANDRKAAEFVLADAQRFNSVDLYQFARTTFGDALMPVDDYAS
ncbi:helix-turn-helix domain-containing protein [Burkholderia contaminans]|uniref:Helix-turn-helix domain-containing protein n=1 Tax=Burkholderia contaminans TaxID=488447 RepID=A0A2S5DRG1_9BURK|nr:helix-turn-helix domain-containing protein [Burkholderia contaminans]POZ81681.1 helix-turn-helix domain-containing protein [Burkholderia contaminans]